MFIKNVFLLLSGSALAQLLLFVSSPIISRLFTAQDFGVYSIILSLVTAFTAIAGFRFEFLMFKCKEYRVMEYYRLSLFLCVILALIFSSIAVAVPAIESIGGHRLPWLFVFLLFIFSGFFYIQTQLYIRTKQFSKFSLYKFLQTALYIIIAIYIGSFLPKGSLEWALMISFVFTVLVINIFDNNVFVNAFSPHKMYFIFKKEYKTATFNTLAHFLSMSTPLLPVFFINYYYSTEQAGLYFFCVQLVSAPFALIRRALTSMLASEITNTNFFVNKFRLIKRFSPISFILVTCLAFLLNSFGTVIFSTVFGAGWRGSGEFLGILFLLFCSDALILPLGNMLPLIGKHKIHFAVELLRLLIVVFGSFILIVTLNVNIFTYVSFYVFSMIMCSVLLFLFAANTPFMRGKL